MIFDYNQFLKSQDGRRPMYIFSLPVLVFASVGVSTASSIPALLFWRFIQSIGASPGMVLGAGVIGDIYKLEERGRAMGIFFAVCDSVVNLSPKGHVLRSEGLSSWTRTVSTGGR